MKRPYEIGYGKPPKRTRFKKGICPNPKGRGARKASPFRDSIDKVLKMKIRLIDSDNAKTISYAELCVRRLVASALKGNAGDARRLLDLRKHGREIGGEPLIIHVTGGLPQSPPEKS